MLFSKEIIESITPLLDQIFSHDWTIEMIEGTLPTDKFRGYIIQDAIYLHHFLRVLAIVASKCSVTENMQQILKFLSDTIPSEVHMQEGYFKELGIPPLEEMLQDLDIQSPNNFMYCTFLKEVSTMGSFAEGLCAAFACPYVYMVVGQHIKEHAKPNNPYCRWINEYADPSFCEAVQQMAKIIDQEGLNLSRKQRNVCRSHFVRASQMEYLFWDGAYKQQTWPMLHSSMMSQSRMPCVLTIAGSDSGGGAGIQADLNTFTANRVFGTTAIAALTAQNSQGIQNIHVPPSEFLIDQINSVLSDMDVQVVKIGMLHDQEVIEKVAHRLKSENVKIILDPVMVATSGGRLLKDAALDILVSKLLPITYCITPNIDETESLLKVLHAPFSSVNSIEAMERAARYVSEHCKIPFVLVKGGHLPFSQRCVDVLYDLENDRIHMLEGPFFNTPNTHGSGCSLAAAVAANLANGFPMLESVANAKKYVSGAIQRGVSIGKGCGTLNHSS